MTKKTLHVFVVWSKVWIKASNGTSWSYTRIWHLLCFTKSTRIVAYWWRLATLRLDFGFYEPGNGLNKCFWRVYTLEQTRPRFQKFKRLVKYQSCNPIVSRPVCKRGHCSWFFCNDNSARLRIFMKDFLLLCSFDQMLLPEVESWHPPRCLPSRDTFPSARTPNHFHIQKQQCSLKGILSQNHANMVIICL